MMPNEKDSAVVFADSPVLLDAVARTMYHAISLHRSSTCPICVQYSRGDLSTWNEARKMPGHTCVTQGCDITAGNEPITHEEWTLAGKGMKQDKVVEAFGLYMKQATVKEILSFDYDKYLTANRETLSQQINEYFTALVKFPDNVFGFANREVTTMM